MKNKSKYLREQFIRKYCKKRGWDSEGLTQNQMLLIVNNKEYKKIDSK